jgi:hypothetical protein
LRLALSKGPNRVGVSPHLRTETEPVPETSCFLSSNYLETGRRTKSENPLILFVGSHLSRTLPIAMPLFTYSNTKHKCANVCPCPSWIRTPGSSFRGPNMVINYVKNITIDFNAPSSIINPTQDTLTSDEVRFQCMKSHIKMR